MVRVANSVMKIRDSPIWDENDFRGYYRRVLVDEHLEWANSYAFEQPTNIGLGTSCL